jgi:hypothetical protein
MGGVVLTSPLSTLPGWDIAERMVRADDFDDMLRAAFDLQPKYRARRFLEPRELGKPPVDPDAEQLSIGGSNAR